MRVRIEGSDLPGLPDVRVGVQRGTEVLDRVPADAPGAVWEFEIAVRESAGLLDPAGPWVHGRRGERFLYLSWGTVVGDRFTMFRRAKLMFGDVPVDTMRAAHAGGRTLVGRLGLTDAEGAPVCARVRPPAIRWSAA